MKTETKLGLFAFGGVAVVALVVAGLLGAALLGRSALSPSASVSVTADELGRQRDENEAAFSQKWSGVTVEVSGPINGVADSGPDGFIVAFTPTERNRLNPVIAQFWDVKQVAHLKPGDRVVIRGRLETNLKLKEPTFLGGRMYVTTLTDATLVR